MDEEPGAKGWENHIEALGEAHWDTGGIGRAIVGESVGRASRSNSFRNSENPFRQSLVGELSQRDPN